MEDFLTKQNKLDLIERQYTRLKDTDRTIAVRIQ
jgi:hypothetical protein